MQCKDNPQQDPEVPPGSPSDSAIASRIGQPTDDSPCDRRAPLTTETQKQQPRFFQVSVGELDSIRRAIKTYDIPPHDDVGCNALLSSLYEAQEESARRVAQRLHDDSAQMLATVYLELAEIRRECPEQIAKKIDGVGRLLDVVCEQIRGLSHELRPPVLDQLGLMPALRFLATGFSRRSDIKIGIAGSAQGLSSAIEIALYRVVQEALSNIVRHAGATQAEVRLWIEADTVHCTITDNGAGFTVPDEAADTTHGLGLLGIYERVTALGGECRIVSCRRKGTEFTEFQVELPL
ncbi:sensor histidine kinase [Litorivivens sp.]|uniref:sensor histidine kinase n=1 Tax=Litorivivens sp. TaxID=2020868 RepID=UPI00356395E8